VKRQNRATGSDFRSNASDIEGSKMALKDLLAQKATLTEEAIEKIVAGYVGYDLEEKEVTFTPAFANLVPKARVLMYLVALQGWRFVSDEEIAADAKPAKIEAHLGIAGGTLRPILKGLKDRHLVQVRSGNYFVRPSSFDAIGREIIGDRGPSSQASPRTRRARLVGAESLDGDPGALGKPARAKKTSGRAKEAGARLDQWIVLGFFDQPRTLAEVQARFHQDAIIIPQTSIPSYLLRAVRAGRLQRRKESVNNKERWIYLTKSQP
jgi:hypothetical protein